MSHQPRGLRGQFVRPAERARSGALLLDPDDIPEAGLVIAGNRSWRTGASGGNSEEGHRAGKAGHVTVWRLFRQQSKGQTAVDRRFWVQIMPLLSPDDAISVVPKWRASLVPDHKQFRILGEREVDGPNLTMSVSSCIRFERTSEFRGRPKESKYVVASTGRYAVVIAFLGSAEAWQWNLVDQVARVQLSKLETGPE